MRGKRTASLKYMARHLSAGKRNQHRENILSVEERAVIKLAVCGGILVLLVALKLLLPDVVSVFGQSVSRLIGADADFKEAFAAMGRAVSGGEKVEDCLQDAYVAVFRPTSAGADQKVNSSISEVNEGKNETVNLSPEYMLDTENEVLAEGKLWNEQIMETETVSFVPALPENVSLEHRNLGFLCTTPVSGVLTSSFGWREHPVVGDLRFHYGLDLAAETGTEICAFAAGEIFATGESSTLGKYIILTHSDGYRTLYGHCDTVLKLSGSVTMGEVIATVGESGTATGPHLHFELHHGTLYLNPIYYVDLG